LGKLLAKFGYTSLEKMLGDVYNDLATEGNFRKAYQFADRELKKKLNDYTDTSTPEGAKRQEIKDIYNNAVHLASTGTKEALEAAIVKLNRIKESKKAVALLGDYKQKLAEKEKQKQTEQQIEQQRKKQNKSDAISSIVTGLSCGVVSAFLFVMFSTMEVGGSGFCLILLVGCIICVCIGIRKYLKNRK
jgi:hypothetical protein